MRTPYRWMLAGLLCFTCARAQTLVVNAPQPVAPGALITGTLTNTTGTVMDYTDILHLLTATGDLVQPFAAGPDYSRTLAPGASATINLAVPANGPGSSGSFVLLSNSRPTAAVRLDVSAATPGFPSLHAWPSEYPGPSNAAYFNSPFFTYDWELANTSNIAHVFGGADVLEVLPPGGATVLAALPLGGIVVPARASIDVPIPISGLTPGPYTVRTTWIEPTTGTTVTQTHGIHASTVNLFLPGGRTVPLTGSLPAFVSLWNFPVAVPQFLVLAAVSPGTTTAFNGVVMPFVISDPVVAASASSGLFGVLTDYVGTAITQPTIPPTGFYVGSAKATVTKVHHPGPMFSGVGFRLLALGFEPMGLDFGASQSEEVVLQ